MRAMCPRVHIYIRTEQPIKASQKRQILLKSSWVTIFPLITENKTIIICSMQGVVNKEVAVCCATYREVIKEQ